MNKHFTHLRFPAAVLFATLLGGLHASAGGQTPAKPTDARQIVGEAQKRGFSASQRYEGILQTFENAGKTSEKRWVYERLGSHGRSKVIIQFTAPAEVRGVALLIVNHTDRSSDRCTWTPALARDRAMALCDRSIRFSGRGLSFED